MYQWVEVEVERLNSSALAMELRLSCIYPQIWAAANAERIIEGEGLDPYTCILQLKISQGKEQFDYRTPSSQYMYFLYIYRMKK